MGVLREVAFYEYFKGRSNRVDLTDWLLNVKEGTEGYSRFLSLTIGNIVTIRLVENRKKYSVNIIGLRCLLDI